MPPTLKKNYISLLPLSILLTSLLALYFELKYFFDQPVGTVIGKYIPCTTRPENILPCYAQYDFYSLLIIISTVISSLVVTIMVLRSKPLSK